MNLLKKCIVTKALLLFSTIAGCGFAWAGPALGTVTDLAGALLAKKADGTIKILSQKSVVESGDTLITEKESHPRIKFIDDSEIMLKPNSQFRIYKFSYEAAKKENDSAVFSLIRGGLRSVTGLVGNRSQDRFSMNTPAATIGVRGTTFFAEYTLPQSIPAPSSPAAGPGLAPGLYVHVIDGMINLINKGVSQNFTADQFGFTASPTQPPILVPSNPGIQFTPPPTFSPTVGNAANSGPKSGDVDCEVR